jgi:hypothetical protein
MGQVHPLTIAETLSQYGFSMKSVVKQQHDILLPVSHGFAP